MLDAGGGAIINIGSTVVVRGSARAPQYAAARYGILGITKSYAAPFAPTVRVNTFAPGFIETQATLNRRDWKTGRAEKLRSMTLMGRIPRPEEVAGTALFLAAADAGHITGTYMVADGGSNMVGPRSRPANSASWPPSRCARTPLWPPWRAFADAAVCSIQNGVGNEEIIARYVARALGITLDDDPLALIEEAVTHAYGHRPSMLQDVLVLGGWKSSASCPVVGGAHSQYWAVVVVWLRWPGVVQVRVPGW